MLRIRIRDNICGGCDAYIPIFSLADDRKMNCVLGKGWSPQSSGCYQLRRQLRRHVWEMWDVWEMHNPKMEFQPRRLSMEYPTGTHGALLDQFCTGPKLKQS